ncbi:tripartite tricarboxylate transporter substrate binding protein [Roseomonas sp. NAR14]|uniref:Tripartite tricarboxylate transporter substrate binding protein n=1 Tax=Roseomonas acroporae TaxID=2937791 RepID=A0A9X2BXB4_9PROT|nr:tripartite tricarboxylate transporter substrate binding protein [Roseomonas acroporae]MCK8785774.1 tripartite tricarboxylate transporter substrate binding protein [Roseomonas acroporae]
MRRRSLVLAGGALALATRPARAQGSPWPDRPIRLVVPWAPGGSTDTTARLLAESLTHRLGQPVTIDNRPGAGGNIGAEAVARAAPDGNTLLFSTSSLPTAVMLYRRLPFDVANDFAPVSQVAFVPNLLVVNPAVPARDVAGLIALARARPGALNYGSSGAGSSQHLAASLFLSRAGIEAAHVPYRGGAPANTDLLADKIQFVFAPLVEVIGFVRAGSLRALAVTTARRSALLPEVPTVAETLPGFEVALWNGVLAPAGTPPAILGRLAREVAAALAEPGLRARLAEQGSVPVGSDPDAFAAFLRAEIGKWGGLVRLSGAQAD